MEQVLQPVCKFLKGLGLILGLRFAMWVLFRSPVRAAGSPFLEGFKALWMQLLGPWVSAVLGSDGGMGGLHDLGGLSQPKRFCDLFFFCILEVSLWTKTCPELPKKYLNTNIWHQHVVCRSSLAMVLWEAMQLQMSFVRGAATKIEGIKLLELCWRDFVFRGCSLCSAPSEAGGFAVTALISVA